MNGSEPTSKELLEHMMHPVRMRILMALAGSQRMTPLQIAEELADVPQATLYRHISRLAKAGLLAVVDERPVRGTQEKVYALNQAATQLGNEAVAGLSKEDHLRFFTSFTMNLIDQFSRYLDKTPQVDYARDGVGYGEVIVFMTDKELVDFSQTMNQALTQYISDREGTGRKKRILSTILMPDCSGKEKEIKPTLVESKSSQGTNQEN